MGIRIFFLEKKHTPPPRLQVKWSFPNLLFIEDIYLVHLFICRIFMVLDSRWPLLLKIEISSNGQNCSILCQKVLKFELYKHNDEFFNIYYRILYEHWTFTYFDRLCKLEKGAMKFKKNLLLWNYWANLNQTLLNWSLGGPLSNCVRYFRPVSKMAAITKNRNFFKWPKLLYFKPESAQIWTV